MNFNLATLETSGNPVKMFQYWHNGVFSASSSKQPCCFILNQLKCQEIFERQPHKDYIAVITFHWGLLCDFFVICFLLDSYSLNQFLTIFVFTRESRQPLFSIFFHMFQKQTHTLEVTWEWITVKRWPTKGKWCHSFDKRHSWLELQTGNREAWLDAIEQQAAGLSL